VPQDLRGEVWAALIAEARQELEVSASEVEGQGSYGGATVAAPN
jgi:hypothetical protein